MTIYEEFFFLPMQELDDCCTVVNGDAAAPTVTLAHAQQTCIYATDYIRN